MDKLFEQPRVVRLVGAERLEDEYEVEHASLREWGAKEGGDARQAIQRSQLQLHRLVSRAERPDGERGLDCHVFVGRLKEGREGVRIL